MNRRQSTRIAASSTPSTATKASSNTKNGEVPSQKEIPVPPSLPPLHTSHTPSSEITAYSAPLPIPTPIRTSRSNQTKTPKQSSSSFHAATHLIHSKSPIPPASASTQHQLHNPASLASIVPVNSPHLPSSEPKRSSHRHNNHSHESDDDTHTAKDSKERIDYRDYSIMNPPTGKESCPRCLAFLSPESIKSINSTHNKAHIKYHHAYQELKRSGSNTFENPCHNCWLDFGGQSALTQHKRQLCPIELGYVKIEQLERHKAYMLKNPEMFEFVHQGHFLPRSNVAQLLHLFSEEKIDHGPGLLNGLPTRPELNPSAQTMSTLHQLKPVTPKSSTPRGHRGQNAQLSTPQSSLRIASISNNNNNNNNNNNGDISHAHQDALSSQDITPSRARRGKPHSNSNNNSTLHQHHEIDLNHLSTAVNSISINTIHQPHRHPQHTAMHDHAISPTHSSLAFHLLESLQDPTIPPHTLPVLDQDTGDVVFKPIPKSHAATTALKDPTQHSQLLTSDFNASTAPTSNPPIPSALTTQSSLSNATLLPISLQPALSTQPATTTTTTTISQPTTLAIIDGSTIDLLPHQSLSRQTYRALEYRPSDDEDLDLFLTNFCASLDSGPLECPLCPDSFSKRSQFANGHVLLHRRYTNRYIGKSPVFSCDACKIAFTLQSRLEEHFAKHHAKINPSKPRPPPNIPKVTFRPFPRYVNDTIGSSNDSTNYPYSMKPGDKASRFRGGGNHITADHSTHRGGNHGNKIIPSHSGLFASPNDIMHTYDDVGFGHITTHPFSTFDSSTDLSFPVYSGSNIFLGLDHTQLTDHSGPMDFFSTPHSSQLKTINDHHSIPTYSLPSALNLDDLSHTDSADKMDISRQSPHARELDHDMFFSPSSLAQHRDSVNQRPPSSPHSTPSSSSVSASQQSASFTASRNSPSSHSRPLDQLNPQHQHNLNNDDGMTYHSTTFSHPQQSPLTFSLQPHPMPLSTLDLPRTFQPSNPLHALQAQRLADPQHSHEQPQPQQSALNLPTVSSPSSSSSRNQSKNSPSSPSALNSTSDLAMSDAAQLDSTSQLHHLPMISHLPRLRSGQLESAELLSMTPMTTSTRPALLPPLHPLDNQSPTPFDSHLEQTKTSRGGSASTYRSNSALDDDSGSQSSSPTNSYNHPTPSSSSRHHANTSQHQHQSNNSARITSAGSTTTATALTPYSLAQQHSAYQIEAVLDDFGIQNYPGQTSFKRPHTPHTNSSFIGNNPRSPPATSFSLQNQSGANSDSNGMSSASTIGLASDSRDHDEHGAGIVLMPLLLPQNIKSRLSPRTNQRPSITTFHASTSRNIDHHDHSVDRSNDDNEADVPNCKAHNFTNPSQSSSHSAKSLMSSNIPHRTTHQINQSQQSTTTPHPAHLHPPTTSLSSSGTDNAATLTPFFSKAAPAEQSSMDDNLRNIQTFTPGLFPLSSPAKRDRSGEILGQLDLQSSNPPVNRFHSAFGHDEDGLLDRSADGACVKSMKHSSTDTPHIRSTTSTTNPNTTVSLSSLPTDQMRTSKPVPIQSQSQSQPQPHGPDLVGPMSLSGSRRSTPKLIQPTLLEVLSKRCTDSGKSVEDDLSPQLRPTLQPRSIPQPMTTDNTAIDQMLQNL